MIETIWNSWSLLIGLYASLAYVIFLSIVTWLKSKNKWNGNDDDVMATLLISTFWPAFGVFSVLYGIYRLSDLGTSVIANRMGSK